MPHQPAQQIEGSFRVISSEVLPAGKRRRSPNAERAVARIVFWNAALVAAVIFLPQLVG